MCVCVWEKDREGEGSLYVSGREGKGRDRMSRGDLARHRKAGKEYMPSYVIIAEVLYVLSLPSMEDLTPEQKSSGRKPKEFDHT